MTRLDARDANHNRLSLVSTLLFLRVPALGDHLSAAPQFHCPLLTTQRLALSFLFSTVLYSILSMTR